METLDNGKLIVFGEFEEDTLKQIRNCMSHESVVFAVLSADNHLGWGIPVGGTIAYKDHVSPMGIGFDIGCGNMAVRTPILYSDIKNDISKIMDEVWKSISFGLGRNNPKPIDHSIFDDQTWKDIPQIGKLKEKARNQLGTVGSGNHFVDILVELQTEKIWIANHFGSRGLGHSIASGFLNLIDGLDFDNKKRSENAMDTPAVLNIYSELGMDYWQAIKLAGEYAYAGRDYVIQQVLNILKTYTEFEVHNNHNDAWEENHFGEDLIVVRKGATPAFQGQYGFVGGNMCDTSFIIRGVETPENRQSLSTTVHGAGRIMSRMKAKGKWKHIKNEETGKKELVQIREGLVSKEMMNKAVKDAGIELRGGGLDETPFCYKKLRDVLNAHANTIEICNELKPIGVAMASELEQDPYKD